MKDDLNPETQQAQANTETQQTQANTETQQAQANTETFSKLFTCISCQIGFKDADIQRNHMKTDWHRYNLKRKVVGLPPLTHNQFKTKESLTAKEALETSQTFHARCRACNKEYSTRGMVESHVQSKRHVERSQQWSADQGEILIVTLGDCLDDPQAKQESIRVRLGKATTENEIDIILQEKMSKATRLLISQCLFCPFDSGSLDANLVHMTNAHSFFIPDKEFLVDGAGLLTYLGDKITVANLCIFCNGRGKAFHSVTAVRMHMIEKGHCKIPFEDGDEDEVAEFYEYATNDDFQWQDIQDDDNDDDIQQDDNDDDKVVFEETGLVLPSGVRIGHRAFKRYWKQYVKPTRVLPGARNDPQMILASGNNNNNNNLITYQQKHNDLVLMTHQQKLEYKMMRRETRRGLARHQDHTARIGQKHNMLQKHYREQNPL